MVYRGIAYGFMKTPVKWQGRLMRKVSQKFKENKMF